ncbi:dihydrofolate reductase [Mycobacterium sp. SMC-11]|uniref:dihydrofolate reductase n=1 Tax=Mycobacterium sp. SMC-11 TaxID=3385969 RepID=UPI00390CBB58
MTISLIWAQSKSGVIGRAGGIPWRVPEDQARYKQLTIGHTVVMGRLTWESLPARVRPLPDRRNVVLTRDSEYVADGAIVVPTLDQALEGDDIWVVGGAEIYALTLPLASRCEVTEVDIDLPVQAGDAVAPALDQSWQASTGDWLTSRTGLRYRYLTYHRTSCQS